MTVTRREFVQSAGLATLALGLGGACTAKKKLNILFVGGTGFLGPATVELLIEHGHNVTLFNRGKSGKELFPNLTKLVGDRDKAELAALEGHRWDVAIDTSGYVPGHVTAIAALGKEFAKQYLFVSSISVYSNHGEAANEDSPVATCPDEFVEKTKTIRESLAHYGAMKALCEQAAEEAMPGRVTVIRPGLIVGPRDRSDRFTYWVDRIDRGGEVLAPGDGKDPVQIIDVRDLAAFMVRCIETETMGIFNAITPPRMYDMASMLKGIHETTKSDATFTWVGADFLEEKKVAPWTDLPVWVPRESEMGGLHLSSSERAEKAGMTFRPFDDTVRATLEWFRDQPAERQEKLRFGLKADREASLLEEWKAMQASAAKS